MSQIHIIDGQTDGILDVITSPNIISNNHRQSLKDTLETFRFTTFADKRFSEFVIGENYVIIPNEDEGYSEFVINEVDKYRDSEGLKIEAYSSASYLMLKKAKVIKPTTLTEYTPSMLVGWTINDTEWRVGAIEGAGYRTLTIDTHTNPFAFLKRIAREFELELRFRVETDGNRVIGRYVDLLERVGKWRGREVEFGRDLIGIRRNEKTDNIYTALIGLGPEDEEGNRLEVLVEDEEALQRWGRPNEQGVLKHLIGTYEPQSTRANMTESELRQYTRTELDKRINEVVTYETTIADLENVPGMQNKKIRYGDTIKIKDTKFNPPLYLEARVFEQDRDIKIQGQKKVKLGDYTEYTEEEVTAIWQQLQAEIRQKLSQRDLIEYTYSKVEIDTKDEYVFDEGKSFAEAVGIEAQEYAEEQDGFVRTDAQGYANNARDEAQAYAVAQDADVRQYAEDKSNEALQQALAETVAQEAYDFQMQSIADELADRTTIEYVDGRLVDKANVGDVYTIEQLDNRFNNYVGITQYTTDMDGIVTDLTDYGTRIGQNEEAIGLQANRIQAVEGTVSDHSAEFLVMADEISSKVDSTYVDGAIDGLEVGGRNLLTDSSNLNDGTRVRWITSTGLGNESIDDYQRFNITDFNRNTPHSYFWEENYNKFAMPLEKNTTYTISIDVRTDADEYRAGFRQQPSSIGSHYPYHETPIKDEWFRHEYTFTIGDEVGERFLWLVGVRGSSGTYIELKNWQLEKGNKATDWTPAPEDVQSEINSVYSYASSEFEQVAGRINAKADSIYVDGVESRVSSVELEINALDGQIQSKVEENDVRSIFTQEADNFTFQADQINFDGHVFGGNATFTGHLEGSVIEGSTFSLTNGGYEVVRVDTDGIRFRSGYGDSVLGEQYDFTLDLGRTVDPSGVYRESQTWKMIAERSVPEGGGMTGRVETEYKINGISHKVVKKDSDHLERYNDFVFDMDEAHFTGEVVIDSEGVFSGLHFQDWGHVLGVDNNNYHFNLYGNRASGRPFNVRSHSDFSSYRDDFWIAEDGRFFSSHLYDNTSSNSAQARVGYTNGTSVATIFRVTSARKYKLDIQPITDTDPFLILKLDPKMWYDKGDIKRNGGSFEGIDRSYGLIADEVAEVGLHHYVDYMDGEIEGLAYERLWTLLIPIVRDHEEEIQWLKLENQHLRGRVKHLESLIA